MTTLTESLPTESLPSQQELAIVRTVLALDRTLMAWTRTATSLITFGFTIYKFFQLDLKQNPVHPWIGPREFALMMIVIGLVSLLLATVEHRRRLQALRRAGAAIGMSAAAVVAALIATLGLVALFAVVLRE